MFLTRLLLFRGQREHCFHRRKGVGDHFQGVHPPLSTAGSDSSAFLVTDNLPRGGDTVSFPVESHPIRKQAHQLCQQRAGMTRNPINPGPSKLLDRAYRSLAACTRITTWDTREKRRRMKRRTKMKEKKMKKIASSGIHSAWHLHTLKTWQPLLRRSRAITEARKFSPPDYDGEVTSSNGRHL